MQQNTAQAAGQLRCAIRSGCHGGDLCLLGKVEHGEGCLRTLYRLTVPVPHQNGQRFGRRIALRVAQVDGGSRPIEGLRFLSGPTKKAAVDQQSPARRVGEPATVQQLLRFTGPQEMPPVPQPDLHPGVVVVAVGPAGDVDLPGGNAKGPQSVYGEDGFLPTAPTAGPVYRQGGGSAQIGGLIGRLLRAPVVDLNGRPLRGEPRGAGQGVGKAPHSRHGLHGLSQQKAPRPQGQHHRQLRHPAPEGEGAQGGSHR